ncbi:MAG: hypothetical protein ACRCWQ_10705 [Bacilli bacterium]
MKKPSFLQWISLLLMICIVSGVWYTLEKQAGRSIGINVDVQGILHDYVTKQLVEEHVEYPEILYGQEVNFQFLEEKNNVVKLKMTMTILDTKAKEEMIVYASPVKSEEAAIDFSNAKYAPSQWAKGELILKDNAYEGTIEIQNITDKVMFFVKTTFSDGTTWTSDIGTIPAMNFSAQPEFYINRDANNELSLSADIPYVNKNVVLYDKTGGETKKLEIEDGKIIFYGREPEKIEVQYKTYNGKISKQTMFVN